MQEDRIDRVLLRRAVLCAHLKIRSHTFGSTQSLVTAKLGFSRSPWLVLVVEVHLTALPFAARILATRHRMRVREARKASSEVRPRPYLRNPKRVAAKSQYRDVDIYDYLSFRSNGPLEASVFVSNNLRSRVEFRIFRSWRFTTAPVPLFLRISLSAEVAFRVFWKALR